MQLNLDWEPYFAIAREQGSFEEKLPRYVALAERYFETEKFAEFCETHLSQLDEVAWTYFGSDSARTAVRKKVEAMYPEHEWDEFTELFWQRIQDWRALDESPGAQGRGA